jgi:hypothetical protein
LPTIVSVASTLYLVSDGNTSLKASSSSSKAESPSVKEGEKNKEDGAEELDCSIPPPRGIDALISLVVKKKGARIIDLHHERNNENRNDCLLFFDNPDAPG